MIRNFAAALIVAITLFCTSASAADTVRKNGIGLGVSTPVFGLLMSRRFSPETGAKIVSDFDESLSIQIDMYGSKRSDTYWAVGLGRDSLASVIKGGFGYEKRFGVLTWSGELGLSLPFDVDDDAGLAVLGYFLNLGLGVRYEF